MDCSVDGCDREVKIKSRRLCGMHYQRWARAQDPERYRKYNTDWRAANREKVRRQARERYRKNPSVNIETARRSAVRRKYGLTLEDYEARLAKGCTICGSDGPRMALDHCHATGKIREPLCANCNNGLGRFFDQPELLRAAAEYLEKHSCRSATTPNWQS